MVAERARNVPETTPDGKRIDQLAVPRHEYAEHLAANEIAANAIAANAIAANAIAANEIAANAIAANAINACHEDPITNLVTKKKDC